MNKKLTKVAALSVSLAMAIGVGVALGVKHAAVKAVKAADDSTTYALITSTDELEAGKSYIITSGTTGTVDAIAVTSNTNNRKSTSVTISDDKITRGSSVLSLTLSGSTGAWKFATENYAGTAGYFTQGNQTSSNYLKIGNSGDDFTITFSGDAAVITSTLKTSRNVIRYNPNNGSPIFSCYTSGQQDVYLWKESSGPALKTMRIQNNSHQRAPFVAPLSDTEYKTTLCWNVSDDSALREGVTWTVSDDSVIDFYTNMETWFFWKPKAAGFTTITCSCDGFRDVSTVIAVYDATPNPIAAIYDMANGATIEVFGYYVGFMAGTGPVIMDGEYGVVAFNSSADVSSYTEMETILYVKGTLSIYNGLYEIASPVIEKATGSLPAAFEPIVYTVVGDETKEFESRLTTATGYVGEVTKGDLTAAAGAADIGMNFVIGSKTVYVYYKKAAQNTADMATLKDSLDNGTEITVTGFTAMNNTTFQVLMGGLVAPVPTYTAAEFAQDLLDQTDAVCATYLPDESQFAEIKAALTSIWSNLAGSGKYPSLPATEKDALAAAERDPSGTVVEQAMARYDFLTGKYSLSNFINGRTPVEFTAQYGELATGHASNATIIVAIVLASVSALSIVTLLVFKKRKHN